MREHVRAPCCGKMVDVEWCEYDPEAGYLRDANGRSHTCPAQQSEETHDETMFEVDDDVPIPEPKEGVECKYPWPDMEPGQSFFVEAEGRKEKKRRGKNIQSAGVQWCERNRPTCTVSYRQVVGGIRVWMREKDFSEDAA